MEWATVQHLDLRHASGRRSASSCPLQPHAATFRASQAIVAVAIGTHIIEFDALTGSKIALIDLGARVVRMAYSPTVSHVVIAILESKSVTVPFISPKASDFAAIGDLELKVLQIGSSLLSSFWAKHEEASAGLRALALLGVGSSSLLSFATIASADEAEHGLAAADYPWPHVMNFSL